MSRVLVLYGTTEGHTARVARAIADTIKMQGLDAEVAEAGVAAPTVSDYEAVVVAASVHAGSYQKPVLHWVKTHAAALNERPTAFVSVSLGILQGSPKVQQEVAAIVDRFLAATGWRPADLKNVAGALPYSRYNLFTRFMMRRIAAKGGGDTDTSKDYEYTDWNDLRTFAVAFAQRVRAKPRAA